jgi:type IV pilus assembly protein PilB
MPISNESIQDSIEDIRRSFPAEFAFRNRVVPIRATKTDLTVGSVESIDESVLNDLEFITGKSIVPVRINEGEFSERLGLLFGNESAGIPISAPDLGDFQVLEKQKETGDNGDLKKELDEVPVITLVNRIITDAIDSGASDIHIEAYEGCFRVRYRRDGVLHEVMKPPPDRKRAVVSRLKIMADLDIAEKRRPQDGRIRVQRRGHIIDIRVSSLPTDFGEKIVLRILDKNRLNLDLTKLGFDADTLESYRRAVRSPYGMILVTGPTGSGKTTTLYATLNSLNSTAVNIITIEDPIEYNLDGINQSQAKPEIGYTFARALRTFLRQDPDVIMVGEIRDQETAEIAIRAALTGHLVLSTLHTNNAPDTLTRLLDMGQEPFLISSAVRMILAQRLLRKVCEACKTEDTDASALERIARLVPEEGRRIRPVRGKGCKKCNDTGYSGRTAIFEAMAVTPEIAAAVNRRADGREMGDIARREGMISLRQSAIHKLREGVTTMEEVLRETEI